MATSIDNIVLVFTARGVQRVQQNINQIGASSDKSQKSVNLLRGALGGLGAVLAVRQVVAYADAYTELQNRMRLVTKSSEEVENATQNIFDIASRTRGNLEETTRTYFRFARANDRLGLSEKELLQITETINQAVAFSGTSAESASSALFQFSQGIAAGTLRGQELNSVLEQVPGLAEVLARGLKVGVDELRRMGEAGQLTGQQIAQAILSQKDFASENFGRVIFTISQEMERLRTNIIKYVGELDKATGFSRVFAGAIRALADNLDILAKSLLVVIGLMAKAFAPTVLRAIKAVVLALAANPLGALIAGLSIAVTAMTVFRDEIVLIEESGVTLGTTMGVVWDKIANAAVAAFEFIRDKATEFFTFIGNTEAFKRIASGAKVGLEATLDVMRQFANPAIGILTLAPRLMVEAFNSLSFAVADALFRLVETIRQIFTGEFNLATFFGEVAGFIVVAFSDAFDFIAKGARQLFQKIQTLDFSFEAPTFEGDSFDTEGFFGPIENRFEGGLERFGAGMERVFRETLTRDFIGDASALFEKFKLNFLDPFVKELEEAQAAKDALDVETGPREPSNVKPKVAFRPDADTIKEINRIVEKFKPANDKLREQLDLLRESRDEVKQFARSYGLSVEQVDEAIAELERRIAGTVDLQRELWTGAAEAMRTALVDVLIDPFNASLKDLARGFIQTMQRIVAEAIAAQAVLAALNFFQGFTSFRIPGATAPVPGSAMGQDAIGGQPRLVGERGPEIIVPASRSNVIPNDMIGGGGNSAGMARMSAQISNLANAVLNQPPPVVNNINEQDPEGLLSTLNTQKGQRVQSNFIQTNNRQVKRDLGVR